MMSNDAALQGFPWTPGAATGIGSMPGTDPAEAMAVVLGELPDFPYLPELPARGVGADITGRAAAMLVDMPVETTPDGWKLAARPGRDQRRAADLLAADLDAAQEAAGDWAGPFKVGVCGPWTLAATLELPRSQNAALSDPGAVADLAASLAEGMASHVEQIRGRIPGATVVLQLDEPALPAVLAGSVPKASGLSRLAAVEATVAADGIGSVLAATTAPSVLHCCARDTPFGVLKAAGARAVAFDLSLLRREQEDGLAELTEAGLGIMIGVVPARTPAERRSARGGAGAPAERRSARGGTSAVSARDTAARVIDLWHRMGIGLAALDRQVVLTPACGLAGATAEGARAALGLCRDAARLLPELIEEGA